ncbi:cyclin-dependent kinase inhibitor 7 isoform X2 [Manihot esculenta]|uniref:Cyclin-dependent kinase inhibitor domain-containing protein n=1 Tax=Manihot esculenta TaxID=3983 RepID=A0A2C9VJK3_MANES|nr:cyclin-dependent kinase inhibitor 7 isoform X2 [Manihot esculenta]OAY45671.1 hypothetical protein MANES_07G081800v8 [Manihot esculenta]
MEDFAKDCKRIGKRIEDIESSKKMKFDLNFSFHEFKLPSLSFECFSFSPDNTISPATSSNSAGFLSGDLCSGNSTSSPCSSNKSSLVVKDSLRFVDLEAKSFETESLTCLGNKFRETTPSSQFYGDTDDMDSTRADGGKNFRKTFPVEKVSMPTQAEMDEFFAEAEKKEQKRFAEKYNYDIAKDIPLEGRYQWLRLKP